MLRPTVLIVALWAIIAAPVLCTAGVLAHECACAESAVCDHESDCDVDPCSEQILRRDAADYGSPADGGPDALARCTAPAGVIPFSTSPDGAHGAPFESPPPLGVPHVSDLPLLI